MLHTKHNVKLGRLNKLKLLKLVAKTGIALAIFNAWASILYFHLSVHNLKSDAPILSVVISTYKNSQLLNELLQSIELQKTDFFVDIIIADNGCFNETKFVVDEFLKGIWLNPDPHQSYQYLPACTNPGYGKGNNLAVEDKVKTDSKWVLFLKDDITLQSDDFFYQMVQLGKNQANAGAVGCKILSADGSEIIEAGSIVWQDGSCFGYGRGSKDINATDLNYARPVDYVSGTCLMIQHNIFSQYGGFNHQIFPNYYEDTDIQMHVQHGLGKEVWLQPLALAHHNDHATLGKEESVALMQKASEKFESKWRVALQEHLAPPFSLKTEHEKKIQLRRAVDIRGRKDGKSRILYIDSSLPNPKQGSGYGRAFDNLLMIAELGHMITVATVEPNSDSWCDESCRMELSQCGIELAIPKNITSWEIFLQSRIGLYEVVIISRPATFAKVHTFLARAFKESPFAVVYDSEALTFRRDELLRHYVLEEGIKFPGAQDLVNNDFWNLTLYNQRKAEVALFSMTDVALTVADSESMQVRELTQPNPVTTFSIGHIMKPKPSHTDFSDREGILYVGAFHNEMYYNGDAAWYFLEKIYPLVLEDTRAPIHLTIAGHRIPQELRDYANNHSAISSHVTFLESPADLNHLYDKARVFIAPHLYGAGIQFKLSEAFSQGIPVVMSGLSAKSFGLSASDGVGCIGENDSSFAKCILSAHNSRSVWETRQRSGFDFIRTTHNRGIMMNAWSEVIDTAMLRIEPWEQCNTTCDDLDNLIEKTGEPKDYCAEEGEEFYLWKYPDVANAVRRGIYKSGFAHFIEQKGNYKYTCDSKVLHLWKTQCRDGCFKYLGMHKHAILVGKASPKPTSKCSEGEELYKSQHSDVAEAVQTGLIKSAFDHWRDYGIAEGRSYFCYNRVKIIR